jgi:thiol peroxidase
LWVRIPPEALIQIGDWIGMMEIKRNSLIEFKGKDISIIGNDLKPGNIAPEFTVHTNEFERFNGLADTSSKIRIIASVPSLETDVCERETRRFNVNAINLNVDIIVMVISMDLPFTQKRWCGTEGIERVITLSDHLFGDFGEKYNCLMKEVRLLRRAVFVVNRENKLVYSDYMAELGVEPNYEDVINAAKAAL